jgi:hypothetical protein
MSELVILDDIGILCMLPADFCSCAGVVTASRAVKAAPARMYRMVEIPRL